MTAVTEAMPEVIAQKFKSLWSCPPDAGASAGLSPELKEMLRKYSRDAYSVSSYRFYALSKERVFFGPGGEGRLAVNASVLFDMDNLSYKL